MKRPAGEDRHVLEHRLAALAEARRLHGADLQGAAQTVDDERREALALDVLGDDQQGLARVGDALEERDQVAEVRDLLLVQEDEAVLEHAGEVLRCR